MTPGDYKVNSSEIGYHFYGRKSVGRRSYPWFLMTGRLDIQWRVKRSPVVKFKKINQFSRQCHLGWGGSIMKKIRGRIVGGQEISSTSDMDPWPAHSCSSIGHPSAMTSNSGVNQNADERAHKSMIRSRNRPSDITFLPPTDRLHRRQSPPRGTHLQVAHHCRRQNPTGRSWETELQSCCLYYCLQSRSLLPHHQPLCLCGQPKRKKKWHQLPCAYFWPSHPPEFTSQSSFICFEKII